MQNLPIPAIGRLVTHHGGPAAMSKLMGGRPVYQEIQRWVKRGWASPKHIFDLEPHLIEGVTVRDLNNDRVAATSASDLRETESKETADV